MRQIVQNYSKGMIRLEEVPVPICRPGQLLVRTSYSLVSTGTERMKVGQARMSLLGKARARPDKVKQVLESAKQNGILETYKKVMERLEALTPLGYSLAGTVEEVGRNVDEFHAGDAVVCAGEGIACHAEFVSVPRNLCARVPPATDLKDACFATVGAIAIQGVRQAGVTLGDSVLVLGLGLVGLLAVEVLKAAGCQVIGVDLDPRRVSLASRCGADLALLRNDPGLEEAVRRATGGLGADVAYIAASTQSTDPLELSGRLVRDRGKVTIVGMVPLEADWRVYYQKELSIVMSRSYGPGRYDPNFEQKGVDYPVGYVRWTERRNLEEFLRLLSAGRVVPDHLEPKVYQLDQAAEVYETLQASGGGEAAAVIFQYPAGAPLRRQVTLPPAAVRAPRREGLVSIGLVGAGNFTTGTLIPSLKKIPGIRLRAICSAGGLSAKSVAGRHGFEYCSSDLAELLADGELEALIIATRHDTHAAFAAQALRSGKHVFVEKPLALTEEELEEVLRAQAESGRILMPGFNRRFSPLSVAVRDLFLHRSGPLEVLCRVNAGPLAADSWYLDAEQGGWRIISEGCHFVDLIQYLCGSPPVRVHAEIIGGEVKGGQCDNCAVTLKMEDGSLGILLYLQNGHPRLEKERIEVFGEGRAAAIENFRSARLLAGSGRPRVVRGRGKGHQEELTAFLEAVRTDGPSPIPLGDAAAATRACLAILDSIATGSPRPVEAEGTGKPAAGSR